MFVTTGFLDRPGFLRSSDLQRLPAELQLGSHGLTHRFLNELTDLEIRDELRTSRRILEDLSGRQVDTVGIPNGAIDDRVTRIAEEEGYSLLFHSEVHINSQWTGPLSIGRVAIRSGTPDGRVQEFAQGEFGLDPVRRLMLGIPKRILGPERYRRWRSWWLGEQSGQKEMQDLISSEATTPGESVSTCGEVCESR